MVKNVYEAISGLQRGSGGSTSGFFVDLNSWARRGLHVLCGDEGFLFCICKVVIERYEQSVVVSP
jgi:hypothetical protein